MRFLNNDLEKLLNTPRPQKKRTATPTRRSDWLPITFGKHEGRTLATILHIDPAYLYYLKENKILKRRCAHELDRQLRTVINQLEHMLAPERDGKRMQFVVIVDRNGIFERFVITPRSSRAEIRLDAGSEIVKWGSQLHMSIVSEYSMPEIGFKRFARCLRETYMSGARNISKEEQYEQYLGNYDNFKMPSFGPRGYSRRNAVTL
jgi:hypothetical protein